jgi:hypothetical protein
MRQSTDSHKPVFSRAAIAPFILISLFVMNGCGVFSLKQKVRVPPRLTPLAEAETAQLFAEINRLASVRSLRGKIDIQFLDTSFAECGISEKYQTADGNIVLQRPGQILIQIQAPLIGTKIAEMTSDGEHFRVAVLQGDEKYRRFVKGTNRAVYPRLESGSQQNKCGDDGNKVDQQRTVSALSGLRPQHFTDALLIPPVAQDNTNLTYARYETFEEEPDTRPGAKKNGRVVRGYYVLEELEPAGPGRVRPLRRFWFDRVGGIRLARVQTFDEGGQLITDVRYLEPRNFGGEGRFLLPSRIELTRPQDGYALRVSYQSPEAVVVNRQWDPKIFALENSYGLPVEDLDERMRKQRAGEP